MGFVVCDTCNRTGELIVQRDKSPQPENKENILDQITSIDSIQEGGIYTLPISLHPSQETMFTSLYGLDLIFLKLPTRILKVKSQEKISSGSIFFDF